LTVDRSWLSCRRVLIAAHRDNDDAGEVNAAFVSLLASCRLHGIEPWSYLRDLICLIPGLQQRRVLELAPASWRQTLACSDTQRLLDANIHRRVTLRPGCEALTIDAVC
jgi:hypothetical protein